LGIKVMNVHTRIEGQGDRLRERRCRGLAATIGAAARESLASAPWQRARPRLAAGLRNDTKEVARSRAPDGLRSDEGGQRMQGGGPEARAGGAGGGAERARGMAGGAITAEAAHPGFLCRATREASTSGGGVATDRFCK